MATIVKSEVAVYSDSACTQQVGSTITTNSAATAIAVNGTTLGAPISAGHQYYVKARATNSEEYVSAWTNAFSFKTLIYASFGSIEHSGTNITPKMVFDYDSNVLSVAECGVYLSKSSTGVGAVKYAADDEQIAEIGWLISGLDENTTYYVVAFVKDSDGREFIADWSTEAETVTTGYNTATVSVTNTSSSYNSISGSVNVTSTSPVTAIKLKITPTGGTSQFKTLAATTTTNFTVNNGDMDDDDNPITINPSTTYNVKAIVTNSGGDAEASANITTQAQAHSTIVISGISNITPTSATVNLTFGDENE